jgi:hypothetical protein
MTNLFRRHLRRAYTIGVRDGIESPHDLSMGMTWEIDRGENDAYDRGANLGQRIGRARERARRRDATHACEVCGALGALNYCPACGSEQTRNA